MGQKISSFLVDKAQCDYVKYRLYLFALKLLNGHAARFPY